MYKFQLVVPKPEHLLKILNFDESQKWLCGIYPKILERIVAHSGCFSYLEHLMQMHHIIAFSADSTEYEVVHEFDARLDSQLSLTMGQVLRVFEKADNGWWRGCHGNKSGWFPGEYVKPLNEKNDPGMTFKDKCNFCLNLVVLR